MQQDSAKNDIHHLETPSFSSATIWVGGTSALAQTYVEEILRCPDRDNAKKMQWNRRFVLASPNARNTKGSLGCISYLPLDLTKRDSIEAFFDKLVGDRKYLFGSQDSNAAIRVTILFGARSSLVTGSRDEHFSLVQHLPYFLGQASQRFASHDGKILLVGVLHISSVAVMNHTQAQSLLTEDAPLPELDSYASAYDVTKRMAEEKLTLACQKLNIPSCVHLRISGIFSNEIPPTVCIQMAAIRIQAYLGSILQTPLDMNTSYNVCHVIQLILDRMEDKSRNDDSNQYSPGLHHTYFYTRPTIDPKPYGNNLVAYRSAHHIVYAIDVPDWCARIFMWALVYLFRGAARSLVVMQGETNKKRHRWLDFVCEVLLNLSYLLTVSLVEHTFDNSRIRSDFPELNALEESIHEGFVRIRKRKAERNASLEPY